MDNDPASPIKTLAGEKLKTTKPSIVPHSTIDNKLNGIFPENKNKTPKKKEARKEINPAKPSKPSIKLIELIITV